MGLLMREVVRDVPEFEGHFKYRVVLNLINN